MRNWALLIVSGGAMVLATGVIAQRKPSAARPASRAPTAQIVTPPKARYVMDVSSNTGFGGMMAGGGKPDMATIMRMAQGGGNEVTHGLRLRLGSTLAAAAAPSADHFFEPPAAMGASVPLMAPPAAKVERGETPEFQRPKGRLIIYWGCGAHAAAGQPVIVDFGAMAAGQVPPDLFSARVPIDRGPSMANSRSYGEWPNQRSGRMPQGGSLIGAHRIAANYAPEIRFSLADDYMAGLNVRTADEDGGTISMAWNNVPGATGYYAWLIGASGAGRRGGNDAGDIIWWSSANSREFGGALWDWIAPGTVARLVSEGVVMAPSTSSCTIPAEVKAATGQTAFGTMVAYGPEANFVYPPRPATGAWNQEWTARVRFRSLATFMPGMPQLGGRGDDSSSGAKPRRRCKPSLLGAVTGIGC